MYPPVFITMSSSALYLYLDFSECCTEAFTSHFKGVWQEKFYSTLGVFGIDIKLPHSKPRKNLDARHNICAECARSFAVMQGSNLHSHITPDSAG